MFLWILARLTKAKGFLPIKKNQGMVESESSTSGESRAAKQENLKIISSHIINK